MWITLVPFLSSVLGLLFQKFECQLHNETTWLAYWCSDGELELYSWYWVWFIDNWILHDMIFKSLQKNSIPIQYWLDC